MSGITFSVVDVSSITAPATLASGTSRNSSRSGNKATPVGLSECVQRCVINVATGGPYGDCSARLEDLACICNDFRFQAATSDCIPGVCPMETARASNFAQQMCAGVMTGGGGNSNPRATPAFDASTISTSNTQGLSAAAVAGVGIGSAIGGISIFGVVVTLLALRFRRKKRDPPLPPPPPPKSSAQIRGQIEAKMAPVISVSPISPLDARAMDFSLPSNSPTGDNNERTPIETVLSRDEQDELHALRERMNQMRRELRSLEERERVELDGGLGGIKELPA